MIVIVSKNSDVLIDVDKVSFMYIVLILLSRNFRLLALFRVIFCKDQRFGQKIFPQHTTRFGIALLAASVV